MPGERVCIAGAAAIPDGARDTRASRYGPVYFWAEDPRPLVSRGVWEVLEVSWPVPAFLYGRLAATSSKRASAFVE